MTVGTALIPLFILASTRAYSFWLGKFAPAAVAAALFIAASFVQIERPHERWNLYRGYQRRFETERIRYQNGAAPYDDPSTRDMCFAERITELELALHDDWSRVLPTSDQVAGLGRGGPA
jgi:Protein of unknown function (DUF4231)